MPERNRQIVLKRRPNGMPVPEDFAIAEGALPEPGEGEVVLRGIYLSLDPYMRGRISGVRSYARPTEIGEVIEGRVVGQVVRSRDPAFREGEYASGGYGWQLYSAVPAGGCRSSTRPRRRSRPHSASSHAGHDRLYRPRRHRPAQSGRDRGRRGGSGAVGAVAGQLAKRHGARVVASPAGRRNAAMSRTSSVRCGDRSSGRPRRPARPRLPNGIDVYFENVGGAVEQAVFPRLNDFARM